MVHAGDSLSPGRRLTYILVLGALTALGPFTVDMYLPAFPAVEAEFGSSTATVQLTLAATMIGFALGQLIVGPWSDRVGRRMPLILATSVHVAASLAVALSPTIEWLIALRVLQGLGAAAGAVVAMAVVRDLFTGVPMVRMLSRLALVSGLAPVVAPLVGSQLMLVMSWRGTFVVLAAYSAVVLVATALFVRETLPEARRHEAGHSTTLQRFRVLLTDRAFVGTVLMAGMNFSGLIGVQTASYLARTIGPQWILAGANILAIASASAIVLLDLASVGLVGVLVPLFLFITACGLSFPCLTALALARHGSEAGTAASLLGAANFGIAAAVTPIVGLFGAQRALPMGAVMLTCALIAGLMLWLVVRPRTVPALTR